MLLPVRRALCLFLAAGLMAALGTAAAPSDAHAQRALPADSAQVKRFRLADAYLRAGQFDQAVALLEDLYAASPETHAFYERLKEAYVSVKRYDEAIALVEKRQARAPQPGLAAEKAHLLYLKGDEDAALAAWDEALALAPESANTYRLVYQSLVEARLFDQAIATIQKGRAALGDSTQFQTELAYLYSLTGQHEAAIGEYLELLQEDERRLGFVRRRLGRFVEQEEARRQSIAATQRAVRRAPLNRAYRELMAWLYMEDGQYAQAFDVYRAVDRLEDEGGRALFLFARQAADAGAYDAALSAYEEILERHPDAAIAPEALRSLGIMHERWAEAAGETATSASGTSQQTPHYERALETYRAFLKKYPNRPEYPDVLRRIGALEQDVFMDLGAAKETLQEVARRYPRTQAADEAAYDLGRIALAEGRLQDARLAFGRLVERLRTGDLADRARYEQALLHFYQGEFDAALTIAQAINANTSTDTANDAIALKVLLIENKSRDTTQAAVKQYATARLRQRQHRPDEALAILDSLLATHGADPLADDARFLRAEVLQRKGQAEAALNAFAEIPLMYPQSHLADQSLFRAAEIQENGLGNPEAALKTYTRLLSEYPGSLLATDARTRIRALRGS